LFFVVFKRVYICMPSSAFIQVTGSVDVGCINIEFRRVAVWCTWFWFMFSYVELLFFFVIRSINCSGSLCWEI